MLAYYVPDGCHQFLDGVRDALALIGEQLPGGRVLGRDGQALGSAHHHTARLYDGTAGL